MNEQTSPVVVDTPEAVEKLARDLETVAAMIPPNGDGKIWRQAAATMLRRLHTRAVAAEEAQCNLNSTVLALTAAYDEAVAKAVTTKADALRAAVAECDAAVQRHATHQDTCATCARLQAESLGKRILSLISQEPRA